MLSERNKPFATSRIKGDRTITMTLNINRASQENCARFFWDLTNAAANYKPDFVLDESSRVYHHTIPDEQFRWDEIIRAPGLQVSERVKIRKGG